MSVAKIVENLTPLQVEALTNVKLGYILCRNVMVRDHLLAKGLIYPCNSLTAQLTDLGDQVRAFLQAEISEPPADNTATRAPGSTGEALPEKGSASPVGVGEGESPKRKGIRNTFLRRLVIIALLVVMLAFSAIALLVFCTWAALVSLWAGLKEAWQEWCLHFVHDGIPRELVKLVLTCLVSWDREAISNPDAAVARAGERVTGWVRK